jgi:hypothetical protein
MELVMDATETDDESLVGDAAHMVAEKPDGPRGASPLSAEERDKYANLLLLCKIHHKLIDDQCNTYPIVRLQDIKRSHEDRVRAALNEEDKKLQRDKETYASIVEEWVRRADLEQWEAWTSWLLSADSPAITQARCDQLEELGKWLVSRIWLRRWPELEQALHNFRNVLQDFLLIFHRHSNGEGEELRTLKFYKIPEWNEARYHRLLEQYERHVALVQDYVLELTRAANFVCDLVRQHLDPSFRMREGVLLVQSGPYMDLSYHTYRVEYRADERELEWPYPGQEAFKKVRHQRDKSFGESDA